MVSSSESHVTSLCFPLLSYLLHTNASCNSVAAPAGGDERLAALCMNLQHVDSFYDSIGGLPGYQLKCLETMAASAEVSQACAAEQDTPSDTKFYMPQGLNIAGHHNRRAAAAAAATGLSALPHMAEILPLGGASSNVF